MTHRRDVIKGMLGGAALMMGSSLYPGLAFAKARTNKRLVVVILRGGMDGLAALAPYGDPDYEAIRGNLALSPDSLLKIDPFFGLHPNLEPLADMYKQGEMIAVPACATPYRRRSHFDAQNILELGSTQAYSIESGWLNRAVGAIDKTDSDLGMALAQTLPTILRGENPVNSWAPSNLKASGDDYLSLVQKVYAHDPLFENNLNKALELQMKSMDAMPKNKNMATNKSRSPQAFLTMAQLAGKWMTDINGPRIATLELGGWDTHAQQGTEGGRLANNFSMFARGINILKKELGPAWSETVVVAMTEFGRTARPNGNRGTDHGTASTAFLCGGALKGGKIIHKWPGLDEANLYQNRDLRPTIDTRSLLKTVLAQHYGLSTKILDNEIFPDSRNLELFSVI